MGTRAVKLKCDCVRAIARSLRPYHLPRLLQRGFGIHQPHPLPFLWFEIHGQQAAVRIHEQGKRIHPQFSSIDSLKMSINRDLDHDSLTPAPVG